MPGSAGGGHSSGGGHSGSFGGGSRSSGGSHSSHSGSFGGGRSSSSGYSGSRSSYGGYHPVYRSGGSYGRRRSGSAGGGGCLSGVVGTLLLPIFILIVLFAVVSSFITGGLNNTSISPESFTGEVVTETVTEKKLDAGLCTPLETTVETDLPDVLDAAGVQTVENGIAQFYSLTGVQPYFLLLSGIDGDAHPDYDTVNSFLYDKYVSTFESDEGHLIVMMLLDEADGQYNYETWYIEGDDAVNVVTDEDCEVILDYIDDYAADSTDVAEVIARAFTAAGQEIMTTVEYHYYDNEGKEIDEDEAFLTQIDDKSAITVSLLFVALVVIVIVIVVRFVVKAARKARAGVSNAANGAVRNAVENVYKQVTNPEQKSSFSNTYKDSGSYTAPKAPAKPVRANYPVTCPNCGATAYPKEDGTCEYCGSKIM